MMANRLLQDSEQSEENFWPTFTDLLSVIILVILLVFISYTIIAQISTHESRQVKQNISQQLAEMTGFRERISYELINRFEDIELDIYIDEKTGSIIFSEGIFFETDSAELREEFKDILKKFIPLYADVLLDDKYRDNIAQIIVEGHTDDQGSYMYNLDLSQQRAFNVVSYILEEDFLDFAKRDLLKEYINATGKSKSAPVKNEDGTINREKSRRVEIKFTLKDQYFIDMLQNIISET